MILGTSRAERVFAHPESVDLRKGDDGLSPLSGSRPSPDFTGPYLFLFSTRVTCPGRKTPGR